MASDAFQLHVNDAKNASRFTYVKQLVLSKKNSFFIAMDQLVGRTCLIKIPKKCNSAGKSDCAKTLAILRMNASICAAYAVIPHVNAIVMRTEYVDLFDMQYDRHPATFDRVFMSVLKLVKRLHKLGVFHLDLKLENVLYCPQTNQVKLIDFETASFSKTAVGVRGTMCRSAPEAMFAGRCGYPIQYDAEKADLFSLGTLYYTAVTGRTVFYSMDHYKNGDVAMTESFPRREMIENLCLKDPQARWSIDKTYSYMLQQVVYKKKKPA